MGLEKLTSTGIQSPVHPACSKLLYRLHYPILHQPPCSIVIRISEECVTTHAVKVKLSLYMHEGVWGGGGQLNRKLGWL
jgi:hypothetical protein